MEYHQLNGEIVKINSYCKQSCADYFEKQIMDEKSQQLVDLLNVFEDYYEDEFGIRHSVCDLRQGWTSHLRRRLFGTVVRTKIVTLAEEIKRYTKKGFLKTRVPMDLWNEILKFYINASFQKG